MILDEKTERQLDERIVPPLLATLRGEKSDEEFLQLLTAVRFSIEIEEFQEADNSEDAKFIFYFQNREFIENDKVLKHTFFNKFQIKIPSDFYREIKKIEGYPKEFYDKELRHTIITEQDHRCGLCNLDLNKIHPHLHHIDYNKKNCTKQNLIFLCPKCHGQTNSRRRFWQDLLTEKKIEGDSNEK